jgi:signal transduction histidine kinase
LRTPITAIRGQLEVAMFTAKTEEQYREAILNALQDIERLSQIVRALLLLSQAESGQLVLQKARIDLAGVVREVVEQFEIPAEETGLRLVSELPAECLAEVDRVQIERMISNLLSNALKFTPQGGEVKVTVENHPERTDRVRVIVEDTGRGIPEEHLPHIFDRFYRVKATGSPAGLEQGLGLGLSFVAWIVKAHKGKIHVDSTPGRGTRFTITLPAGTALTDTMEFPGSPVTLG